MKALSLFPPSALFPSITTRSSSLTDQSPKSPIPKIPSIKSKSPPIFPHLSLLPNAIPSSSRKGRRDFRVRADEGDGESGSPDDYDMEEEEAEEVDNKKDYDVEYDRLFAVSVSSPNGSDEIEMVQSKSFVSTQGWDSEMVVDYRINEDEFHKISLLDCDFFIRKPPDPDDDVYDFREMYVTPPDTDAYAIPRVLAPMPQKYIRCSKSDYGCYNVTEPPIDAPRDPLYKSTREIMKVTVPEGINRDRRKDLLIIRDNGASFKIIPMAERDDPTTIIEREEWIQTRKDMEKHLRKLRDFSISNWF
ncbi:PLASTID TRANSCRIPTIONALLY ACTIVE protein 6, chloroplastic isoform X2 [Magnolia sinica]|uniref:PLASTID TRANSCRIPTIONALLY ACTIVE protein 6, chloroplastic isoform X2 n=1 Tax=Magnolia sinica TaxID=86752 RepID=UPI00265A8ED5|nr:PLASTID TRANSCRIPTIONALLY ACTIVE protein 6, chloroplastic isoform X2 [Magnolia sinica]